MKTTRHWAHTLTAIFALGLILSGTTGCNNVEKEAIVHPKFTTPPPVPQGNPATYASSGGAAPGGNTSFGSGAPASGGNTSFGSGASAPSGNTSFGSQPAAPPPPSQTGNTHF